MQAVILSIGDELTLGQNVDTNSAWLSERLTLRGVSVRAHATVADVQPNITAALRHAADHADLILVTGGLGPTDDDLTRQALADAMGVALELHQPSLDAIEGFFAKLGRPMPPRNRIQAMCPASAIMLANDHGTAPGLRASLGKATIFVFPGVPREMKPMFDRYVEPFLAERSPRDASVILTERLLAFGRGESTIAEMLGDLCDRNRNPLVGTTVADAIISVRIRSRFADAAQARAALEDTIARCEAALGEIVFGRGDDTLAGAIGRLLRDRKQTVTTAESCTGGMLAAMLTDLPGSSDYYLGGFVTYANEAKSRDLAVPAELIAAHGAVSGGVAQAMAEGARARTGADHALSITGIAGPAGGTDDKPVGTVWIALASRGQPTTAERFLLGTDRPLIRDRAAKTALNLLRLRLM